MDTVVGKKYDYHYSITIVYNTFSLVDISEQKTQKITIITPTFGIFLYMPKIKLSRQHIKLNWLCLNGAENIFLVISIS